LTLHSRLLDVLKSVDALIGIPLAQAVRGATRPLPTSPADVLIVRLWGLGNLALLAPMLTAPTARRVRVLTLARNADFLSRQFPRVEALTLHEPPHPACLPDLAAAVWRIAREPPDVIVDCEQFLRVPALLLRASCRSPLVGLDTPGQQRGPLLDRPVAHDPTRHVADTFGALARAAGLTPSSSATALEVAAEDRERLRPLLPAGNGPLVVLHPGSGDHFPGRRWPPERYGELAVHLLSRHDARIVLTGSASERALVRRVRAHGPPGTTDLSGLLDTGLLLALLAHADLVVSNDTGPVHLADALGTPVVALYGPNTPHRYGPRGPHALALYADLPCSPCLDDRTMKRSSCRHHVCMDALSVGDVLTGCSLRLSHAASEREDHALVH
jgi:ADP-heptose:LPS heptosyltransferase